MVLFNTDYPPAFHTQPRLFSKDRQHGDKVAEPLHSRGDVGLPPKLDGEGLGPAEDTRGRSSSRAAGSPSLLVWRSHVPPHT